MPLKELRGRAEALRRAAEVEAEGDIQRFLLVSRARKLAGLPVYRGGDDMLRNYSVGGIVGPAPRAPKTRLPRWAEE